MKRSEITDPFLRGYLDAALFTTDPAPPGGCDYVESGRADEMFQRIPDGFLSRAKADCADFEAKYADLLGQAGDYARNGADFFYTRNGYGAGFWDRGYGEIGDKLTAACKTYKPHDLELTGWFLQEYRCQHCRSEWTRPEDSASADFGYDFCEACDKEIESENIKRGDHLTPIAEPAE